MAASNSLARKAWGVGLLSFALVVYPPVFALLHAGVRAAFAYVQGDAFLYLTVARNSRPGWFSFDGTTATNGFHPLWQYILTFLFSGETAEYGGRQVLVTALLSTFCAAAGVALSGLAILRMTRSAALAMLTIPGLYYVVLGVFVDNHTVWSDIGGMEASLSALFGGVLLYVIATALGDDAESTLDGLVAERGLGALFVRLGLILPFVVLARLDDVFVLVAFSALPLLSSRPIRERLSASVRVAAPSAVVLSAYMLHSKLYAGTFLPVSGATKAGFVLHKSLYIAASGFLPWLVDIKNALSATPSNLLDFYHNHFRALQLLFPAVVAALFLYAHRARLRVSARSAVLGALALGVIFKVLYNLAFVHLWHQGTWYFALNIMCVTLLGAVMLEAPYRALLTPRARLVFACMLGVWIALSSSRHAIAKTYATPLDEYHYWESREQTTQSVVEGSDTKGLLAFDDGITGYALSLPTIHGFAFASDAETSRALKERRLLAHAHARGHRVLTSASYFPMERPIEGSVAIREFLRSSILEPNVTAELDDFDFRLVYLQPDVKAPFIEFRPRQGELAPQMEVVSSPPPRP